MMKLEFENDVLSWNLESGEIIQKIILDLFYAYYDSNNGLIIAESGKNFTAKENLAFQKNGVQFYKLEINYRVSWIFENKNYFFEYVGLYQVLFFLNFNKIFLLINNSELNEIIVLSMDSVILNHIFPEKGDRFLYLEQIQDNLFATIESNQVDNFGRNQFKYSINVENYEFNIIGLSY